MAEAVNKTKKLLLKPVPIREISKPVVSIDKNPLSKAIYEFRNQHAKIIDEPPSEVLTDNEIERLCKLPPRNSEQLENFIKKSRRNMLPECFQSWNKIVLRILQNGPAIWKQLDSRRDCHVCQGKFEYGHLAWGCVEPYSSTAVTEFMNKPQNKTYRDKEDERRLRNWKAKYGDIPCPYLKNKRGTN